MWQKATALGWTMAADVNAADVVGCDLASVLTALDESVAELDDVGTVPVAESDVMIAHDDEAVGLVDDEIVVGEISVVDVQAVAVGDELVDAVASGQLAVDGVASVVDVPVEEAVHACHEAPSVVEACRSHSWTHSD